jgi:hypothetical protein
MLLPKNPPERVGLFYVGQGLAEKIFTFYRVTIVHVGDDFFDFAGSVQLVEYIGRVSTAEHILSALIYIGDLVFAVFSSLALNYYSFHVVIS